MQTLKSLILAGVSLALLQSTAIAAEEDLCRALLKVPEAMRG